MTDDGAVLRLLLTAPSPTPSGDLDRTDDPDDTRETHDSADSVTDRTAERILDAAVDEIRHVGMHRLTIEGVAGRAHVSRITVYRHFESKDRLTESALAREASRILARIGEADQPGAEPVARVSANFVAAVEAAYAHPLIDHWLRHDPSELLRQLLADDAHILELGTTFLVRQLEAAGVEVDPSGQPHVAEAVGVLVRLYLGLLLMPPAALRTKATTERLAREIIAPLVITLLG